ATVLRYVIRSGDKDFRAILGTIPKDVNGIYASLWAPDAALIAKQLPDVGLDVRMMGPAGQFEPVDYIQASAGGAEGNYVTFFVPDMKKVPAAVEFVKAYEAKYGSLSSYGPLAYEAANIILTAVQKVGKADRAAVRDAVRATKDYRGILGQNITFDAKGDVTGVSVYVYQVKGKGFEYMKPVVVKKVFRKPMALFETPGLTKDFGGLRALDALDLRVEEGEIVGLIGPNGSGKTTVFNVITGIH